MSHPPRPPLLCVSDCCDGTDEWSGRVTCPNTCLEVGASTRQRLVATAQAHRQVRVSLPPQHHSATSLTSPPHAQGLAEREKLAATSEEQVAAWHKEHSDLETPLAAQEDRVAALLAKKEAAETAEREVSQLEKASTVAETAPPTEGSVGETPPPASGNDAVPADETDEERGRRIARQWTNDVRGPPPSPPP
jgi:protein kinase C substrate 80K-H